MYIISSNGERLAMCEEPRYIKINPTSGCFIQATVTDAQGVAVLGTPYNLPGHSEIMREIFVPTEGGQEGEGTVEKLVAPEVELNMVNAYDFLGSLEDKDGEIEDELTNTQLALCEIYEAIQ